MLLGEGRITGNREQQGNRCHEPPADPLKVHRHPLLARRLHLHPTAAPMGRV